MGFDPRLWAKGRPLLLTLLLSQAVGCASPRKDLLDEGCSVDVLRVADTVDDVHDVKALQDIYGPAAIQSAAENLVGFRAVYEGAKFDLEVWYLILKLDPRKSTIASRELFMEFFEKGVRPILRQSPQELRANAKRVDLKDLEVHRGGLHTSYQYGVWVR